MDALVFVLQTLEEAVMVHNQDKVLEQADKLFTLSVCWALVWLFLKPGERLNWLGQLPPQLVYFGSALLHLWADSLSVTHLCG